ncbi:ribosomal protein L29 (mitochondrion) [Monosiga brevicollis]|uniref:Ribosomal protein L29 n=1 Tax=Monosiga brevicollis TaxID=81824 RepID=Q8HIS1_MONBE|nr:ribosomal protein L29 [Monosiga brevicollis]AAN28363.1 ribosomal protein L29 [Monosiga brevicollis]|eukprot:NP_696993.1 ribosomal protein L29 (mitochondrion) [Monosiga brevicollis ATCC 50154]
MQVKRYKPITPSLRHKILANTIRSQFKNDKNPFSSKKEGWFKYLKYNKLSAQAKGGRNNQGKITVRCRGGGHKRRLRLIDRSRELGIYTKSEIIDIQYNPNISSNIALLSTLNTPSIKFYILASNTMKIGDIIEGYKYNDIEKLNNVNLNNNEINNNKIESNYLYNLPIGTNIYNITSLSNKNILNEKSLNNIKLNTKQTYLSEKNLKNKLKNSYLTNHLNKNNGVYSRAAGTFSILLKNIEENNELRSIVRLPSKKIINIPSNNIASIGKVSNELHKYEIKGKAGTNRLLNNRPKVRGKAQNPVDHPMGGKTSGSGGLGKPKKTAWGKLAKWQKKK